MRDLDFTEYEEGMEQRRGLVCPKSSGNKKARIVSFSECLACRRRPRCLDRRVLINFGKREDGGYYDDRYGAYHVTSTFYCKRSQQLSKIVGEIYKPKSIWAMSTGSARHDDMEKMKFGDMITERQLIYDFNSVDGDSLQLKGKFDGFIHEVEADALDEGLRVYEALEGVLFSGNMITDVIEEIKTTKTLRYVKPSAGGISDNHKRQPWLYVALNEELNVVPRPKAIYVNYINRFDGSSIGYLNPVLVKGTELADVVKRKVESMDEKVNINMVELDTNKILDAACSRVESLHRNLRDGMILDADPEYDWECSDSVCPYGSVCDKYPHMIINDDEKSKFLKSLKAEYEWTQGFLNSNIGDF